MRVTASHVKPFEFDRSWYFEVTPAVFWQIVGDTDEFPLWWGWLRTFESDGLVSGSTTDFVVQGALPYKLHFVVTIDQVTDEELVETTVSGDLEGPARLEITPEDGGCRARLQWRLEPRQTFLRRMAIVSHPLLTWSHDQVVAIGVKQFRRRLERAEK
jgi:uncharacterized protein YndB with AHSA1/START domain